MQAPEFRWRGPRPELPEDALWEQVGRREPVDREPGDGEAAEDPPTYDPKKARGHGRGRGGAHKPRLWLHVGLFAATTVSCYLLGGIWYAAGLMAFLLTHEMGHYLMSVRWGVVASLPYFIPLPSIPYVLDSPFGTMGAVITMRSPMPNRKALMDIGAAGPLAGFVVASAIMVVGIGISEVVALPDPWPPPGYMAYIFGDSLLMKGMIYVFHGAIPESSDLMLHPLARAGWVGLFVTALNLLPVGQLDGGHITYALFRRHYDRITQVATLGLLVLVMVSYVWILFAVLAIFLGRKHPPPLDDRTEIDRPRRIMGYVAVAIFVLCFMPDPLQVVWG